MCVQWQGKVHSQVFSYHHLRKSRKMPISVPAAVGGMIGSTVTWNNPKHGQTWNFTAECAWGLVLHVSILLDKMGGKDHQTTL